jgi:hypothetical protein
MLGICSCQWRHSQSRPATRGHGPTRAVGRRARHWHPAGAQASSGDADWHHRVVRPFVMLPKESELLRGRRLHWKRELMSCGRLHLYRRLTRMLVLAPLQTPIANRSPGGCGGVPHLSWPPLCAAYAWRWFLTYSAWFSGSRRRLPMPGICSW